MAKIELHDFGGMLNELNKVIVREVKAALSLLPCASFANKRHVALCYIIIGSNADYSPRDVKVDAVWIDAEDGLLHISGRDMTEEARLDCNVGDNMEPTEWTEQDSLYDITDFHYLIEQIAATAKDCEVEYINKWELNTHEG